MGKSLIIAKYNIKSLLRSKFTYGVIILYIILLALYAFKHQANLFWITGSDDYKILVYIYMIFMAIRINEDNSYIVSYLDNNIQRICGKILSLIFIYGIFLGLFIVTLISLFILSNYSINHFISIFVANITTFTVGAFIYIVLGLTISRLNINKIKYFIAIIAIVLLNNNFFLYEFGVIQPKYNKYDTGTIIQEIMNINMYFEKVNMKISSVVNLDTYFWSHIFMFATLVIAIIIILLSLEYEYKNRKNCRKIILTSILITSLIGILFLNIQIDNFKQRLSYNTSLLEVNSNKYTIEFYNMKLTLSNKIENECEIGFNVNNKDEGKVDLELMLDSNLIVDEIKLNGKVIEYKHNNNIITISSDEIINNENNILNISYKGKIKYADEYDMYIYYSNLQDSYLTDNIAWYPIISLDTYKDYKINVETKNSIESNLKIEQLDNKKYTLTGKSKGIYVMTGYFYNYDEFKIWEGANEETINYLRGRTEKELTNLERFDFELGLIQSNIDDIDNRLRDMADLTETDRMFMKSTREMEVKGLEAVKRDKLLVEDLVENYTPREVVIPIYFNKGQLRNIYEKYCYDGDILTGSTILID